MAGWYETLFVVPGFYRLHRLAESSPRNRFLGSLNVYKYGLRFKNQLQYVQLSIHWAFKTVGSG